MDNAVQRQIDGHGATGALLFRLAYEGADGDCRAVLAPVRGKFTDIAELIGACQDVGAEAHRASVLAAALIILFLLVILGHIPTCLAL